MIRVLSVSNSISTLTVEVRIQAYYTCTHDGVQLETIQMTSLPPTLHLPLPCIILFVKYSDTTCMSGAIQILSTHFIMYPIKQLPSVRGMCLVT